MADYHYLHFASLWNLSNQNWKYYKNLQLRLQQSSVHSSVFHFHFVVFVATPLVVMAIGMKLWFKKLGMNQTSRSNQRNGMINRRVSVMLRDCFDIWNTLASFLVRQCLLLYSQVHISLSWLPSKLCCKVLETVTPRWIRVFISLAVKVFVRVSNNFGREVTTRFLAKGAKVSPAIRWIGMTPCRP